MIAGAKRLARNAAGAVAVPAMAIATALIIGAIVVWRSGENPLVAYSSLLTGAFGSRAGVGESIVYTTPLVLTGLSVAVAFRCGLFNIGAEGQYIVGMIAAAWAGYAFTGLPAFLHVPITLLTGAAAGAAWAAIPGVLKARLGVHEVINTIMMNHIAIYFTHYLVVGPLLAPPGYSPMTRPIADTAKLQRMFGMGRLHAGIVVAILAAVVVYYLLWKTTTGYKIRAVGLNQDAARYGGIDPTKSTVIAMSLSGALAGMAGAVQIQGLQYRFLDLFGFPGHGLDGIAVALLGQNHPVGIVLSALLFGSLASGSMQMQSVAGIPKDLVGIIQAIIIFFVAADQILKKAIRLRLPGRTAATALKGGTISGSGDAV